MGPCGSQNAFKKSNENLEAFLEVEKVVKKLQAEAVKTRTGPGMVEGRYLRGGPRLTYKYTCIRAYNRADKLAYNRADILRSKSGICVFLKRI